jgi:excinuclease UvrABC ATPase subunit
VDIPQKQTAVIAGVSGSGKSSPVFGTAAAGAQRNHHR